MDLRKNTFRDVLQTKFSFNSVIFNKGGGVVPGQFKGFGAFFCAPTISDFWVEKDGGVDQIQKLLGTFSPSFLVKYDKKVPQKFRKKIAYGKVPQKFQNS